MAVNRDESKPYVRVTVEVIFPKKRPPANKLTMGAIAEAEHLGWNDLASMVHGYVSAAYREMALAEERDAAQTERRAKMNKTIGGQKLN